MADPQNTAERALAEHLALVRGESPEPGTAYHETITDFRRTLIRSSRAWDKMHEPYFRQVCAWLDAKHDAPPGQEPARPDQAIFDASAAGMMASAYAYTLAAVIAVAQTHYGDDVAQHLAGVADDILTNGDFEDANADVVPEDETAPGVTQGLEIILPAATTDGGEQ